VDYRGVIHPGPQELLAIRWLVESRAVELCQDSKTAQAVLILDNANHRSDPLLAIEDLPRTHRGLCKVENRDRNIQEQGLDESTSTRVVPDVLTLRFRKDELTALPLFKVCTDGS
jgi:hypothetical protein